MDLIGIENEAEFFPSGTLSDVLKDELQDITGRWSGLEKSAHPVERLSRVAGPTVESLRQVRNNSDAARRRELLRDAHHALVGSLRRILDRMNACAGLSGRDDTDIDILSGILQREREQEILGTFMVFDGPEDPEIGAVGKAREVRDLTERGQAMDGCLRSLQRIAQMRSICRARLDAEKLLMGR